MDHPSPAGRSGPSRRLGAWLRPPRVASAAAGRTVLVGFGFVAWLAAAPAAAAHEAVPPAPTPGSILFDWSFEPLVQVPLILTALAYLYAATKVSAAHPRNPWPRSRLAAFLAGLAAIEIALESGIAAYDTTLFSIHMVQHVLLMMVAAPLLLLGSPITLLMRLASHRQRVRWILPVLHSRFIRVLSFPVVSWLIFAAVMWGSHFSQLFELSLEDPLVHDLEHLLFLASALLFWWPAIGLDPAPWRLPHPLRVLYVFLQMPQNTFLALAIFSSSVPLYSHYATLVRSWGPTVLDDQQIAGAVMWIAGDMTFLVMVLALVYGWMRDEERQGDRLDARADAQRSEIRRREARLAQTRAAGGQPGSGVER